jgi:NTP pyrophosphatase (non-canonical NTP hydrolase)
MTEIQQIIEAVIKFRDERDWKQFHNAKDLSIAINVEAGELLELFLWKSADAAKEERIEEELADVLIFCLLLAHEKGIDVKQAIFNKLTANDEKYPVDKSKGNAKKYTEL